MGRPERSLFKRTRDEENIRGNNLCLGPETTPYWWLAFSPTNNLTSLATSLHSSFSPSYFGSSFGPFSTYMGDYPWEILPHTSSFAPENRPYLERLLWAWNSLLDLVIYAYSPPPLVGIAFEKTMPHNYALGNNPETLTWKHQNIDLSLQPLHYDWTLPSRRKSGWAYFHEWVVEGSGRN